MQDGDPDHIALISAIKNGKFDNASEILEYDHENKYVGPLGVPQVTALQMAAWQGNIDLLNQLHERGADINSKDKIGRCALYYAVYNGNTEVTEWLLEHGGDVNVKIGIYLKENFIPDYIYIANRQYYSMSKGLLPILYGGKRTPLQFAVEKNYADIVRVLVESGANVNVEDEYPIIPLFLARILVNLNDPNEMNKFNEIVGILVAAKTSIKAFPDNTKITRLHVTAMLRSVAVTKILLNGVWPLKNYESMLLHYAAELGNIETLLLEAISPEFDNDTPYTDITALHVAAFNNHRKCAQALIRHEANLVAKTKTGITVVDAIFSCISQPLDFLIDVLNSCVTPECDKSIVVNFHILTPRVETQMAVVTAIIAATSDMKQLAILQHPVVEIFLRLKWKKIRIFFFLLIFIHTSFIIFLSNYALMFAQNDADHVVTRRIVATCSCILLLHNIIQIILEPKYYRRQLEMWLSLICVILSLITSIAEEFVKCSKEEIESRHCMDWMLHSISIAILLSWMQMMLLISRVLMWGDYALMFYTVLRNILKVLLAFGFLIFRFALSLAVLFRGNNQFVNFWSFIKITVVMMGEYDYDKLFEIEDDKRNFLPVTSGIVFMVFVMLVLLAFGTLIIGFEVSFAVLFPGNDDFKNFWSPLKTTVVMMMGKYEFGKLLNTTTSQNGESTFLMAPSRFLFIIFIMIASTVLINLVIGLVTSKIQRFEKKGYKNRLLNHVKFFAQQEILMSHKIFPEKWLPSRLEEQLLWSCDVTPNITVSRNEYDNFFDILNSNIPVHLKDALFRLAKKSFKDDNLADRNRIGEP
ncbi:transient receptor potential channel pyrexia-like isoform X2 [Solenopsis invicta]|uniref:transient receptor potential channel pyrexia-like isoform X2 n=1 Tax=Solenopsis invicta TaxID=13686 RepID=UPI00193D415C|nr:transient receptor potential channel pyrexia-like isoform X2 [Solenopsis invicta]XP_039303122.1 transient receptor potential channel pyrexia-like isoform X2 [Solenopsis invicta]